MLFDASALHRTGSLPVSNYTREPEQRTCQNRSMSGTCENVRIRRSHVLQVWFRTGCYEDPLSTYWQVTACRRYLGRVMPNLFIRERRVVRLIPSRAAAPVGCPMLPFVAVAMARIRM